MHPIVLVDRTWHIFNDEYLYSYVSLKYGGRGLYDSPVFQIVDLIVETYVNEWIVSLVDNKAFPSKPLKQFHQHGYHCVGEPHP